MKKLLYKYRELISYLLFGVATTAVNWVVYTVMIKLVTDSLTLSNAVAWGLAVLFAFVTNKLFVFQSSSFKAKTIIRELISFFLARCLTGAMEIFLPTLLYNAGFTVTAFEIDGGGAKALVSIGVIVLNYVFGKLLVFRKK